MVGKNKSGKRLDIDTVRRRMAGLCARSEQCSGEIVGKLLRAGLSPREATDILEFLKAGGFVDDYRYCRAFARDKVAFAGWGPRKISWALYLKRLPEEAISEAIEGLDDEEVRKAAERAAASKARSIDLSDREGRLKLMRYMASRGFEAEMCRRIIYSLNK